MKDTTFKMFHSSSIWGEKPYAILAKSIKGCANVVIKQRKSYYYAYLVAMNETNQLSIFDLPNDDDDTVLLTIKDGKMIRKEIQWPKENTKIGRATCRERVSSPV